MGGIKPPAQGEDKHVKESSDLYRGAEENNLSEVQNAIAAGADVNTQSLQSVTPLLLAVKNGNLQMAQFLLSKNANPNIVSSECGPLHEAVRKHNVQLVELLTEKKANVNLPAEGGKTPIQYAILEKHYDLVELLLKKGADPKVKSLGGANALHFVVMDGDRTQVEKFLSCGLNEKNANGKTPLHIAAEKGNIDAIKVLLNNNAVTNIKDALGRLPAECGKITAYNMISNHKPGQKYEYITVDDDDEDEKGAKKAEPAKPDPKKPAVVDDKKKKK
jgi:ankyrin repeat protein